MPLSDAEQFQALLTVYQRVNERAMHYHSIMWQTAQVFSSGFTVLVTGSFFFFTYRQAHWRAWSIPMAFAAMLIALWGKQVLAQERTLFAYELQVRRRIEVALGWQLQNPTVTPLPAFPRLNRWLRNMLQVTPFAEVVSFEMSYDPARVTYDPKKYNDLRFDGNDTRLVAQAAQTPRGVYGVFSFVLSAAWLIALFLQILYAARLYRPAFIGWGSDEQSAVTTTTTSTSTTGAATTSTTTTVATTTSTAAPPTTLRRAIDRTRTAPPGAPAAERPHSGPSPPRRQ